MVQYNANPRNFTLICLKWADGGCPLHSYQILEEPVQDGTGRWFWFDGLVEVFEASDTQAWLCVPDLRHGDRALQTFVRDDVMQVFRKDCELLVTTLSTTDRGPIHHPQSQKLYNFLKGLVNETGKKL